MHAPVLQCNYSHRGQVLATHGHRGFDGIAIAIGKMSWSLKKVYLKKTAPVEEKPTSCKILAKCCKISLLLVQVLVNPIQKNFWQRFFQEIYIPCKILPQKCFLQDSCKLVAKLPLRGRTSQERYWLARILHCLYYLEKILQEVRFWTNFVGFLQEMHFCTSRVV